MNSNKITLLVKNVQHFTVEVHPDRIDEVGTWQDVIDLDMNDLEFDLISDDYYEVIEVLKELT